MCQSVDYWQTDEYFHSGGLDLINAAEAYAQGYTGKGIRVGVMDTGVGRTNSELVGQVDIFPVYSNWGDDTDIDEDGQLHGTHVGGIIAAHRDGAGMHGVAFDSKISSMQYSLSAGSQDEKTVEENRRRFQAMVSDPSLRVINNSWKNNINLPKDLKPEDFYGCWDDLFPDYPNLSSKFFLEEVNVARQGEKVVVFAAGNEGGEMAPNGMVSYFDPSVKSWLAVTAVNAAGAKRNERGEIELAPEGFAYYTNRAGIETALYTLAAPGSNILAPQFMSQGLIALSGTSMAAPHVSGAVAVVAEAFPWMNGKQLADTVLTTADPIILPDFGVLRKESILGYSINIVIDKNRTVNLAETLTKENIRRAIERQLPGEANRDSREYFFTEIDELFETQGSDPEKWNCILRLSSEEVFGQGMLNLGHAVNGIGRLDTNRLSASNVREMRGLDGSVAKGAVETFDTKGWSAVFSNDIDERLWDDKYHHPDFQTGSASGKNADAQALEGLGAGLEKTGEGLLTLSGKNTYTGPTVVSGGRLSISKREDGTGGELLHSHVFVNESGVLQGNGIIHQTVHNRGIVAPGNSIGSLTVGDYYADENGILQMEFSADGSHDKLIVTGVADLRGELQLLPRKGFYRSGKSLDFQLIEGSTNGTFDHLSVFPRSPTLSFGLKETPEGIVIEPNRPANAYSQFALHKGAERAGHAVGELAGKTTEKAVDWIASLDFSDPTGRDVQKALQTLHPEIFDASTMAEWDSLSELNRFVIDRSQRRVSEKGEGFDFELLGGSLRRQGHNGYTGWRAETTGVQGAWSRTFQNSLTGTVDIAVLRREAEMSDGLPGKIKTTGAYVGMSVDYRPESFGQLALFGGARFGLTDNDLRRTVVLPEENVSIKSDWRGLSGSLIAGADWHWDTGSWRFGPVAWTEVVSSHRPTVKEKTSHTAGLTLESETFSRTAVNAGFHATGSAQKGKGLFTADLSLTRRETLTKNTVESRVGFIGTDTAFQSSTDHAARDAWIVEVGTSLRTPTLHIDFKGRAEVAETGGADSAVNLRVGYRF